MEDLKTLGSNNIYIYIKYIYIYNIYIYIYIYIYDVSPVKEKNEQTGVFSLEVGVC